MYDTLMYDTRRRLLAVGVLRETERIIVQSVCRARSTNESVRTHVYFGCTGFVTVSVAGYSGLVECIEQRHAKDVQCMMKYNVESSPLGHVSVVSSWARGLHTSSLFYACWNKFADSFTFNLMAPAATDVCSHRWRDFM